jgi:hypothetical protein
MTIKLFEFRSRQWLLMASQIMLCCALIFATTSARADSADALIHDLIDGLHEDASNAVFDSYFARYTKDAVFMGTDKSERWTIDEFKDYAAPVFAEGRGWTYSVIERNLEGAGDTRWFDEILFNEKLGHCRGTGVVVLSESGWQIAHYSLTLLIPNDIAAEVGAQTIAIDKPEPTN